MNRRGHLPAEAEAPGELLDLGRLHIPASVTLATYGQDLTVTAAIPGEAKERSLVGLPLEAALDAAESALLNAAARRALKGRGGAVVIRTTDGRRLAVRFESAADGATALWFDISGVGISAEAERERADELERAFAASRGLARSMYVDEARGTICEAALSICDADHVALLEPDPGGGGLALTGAAGLPELELGVPLGENSSATLALRTNAPRLCTDPNLEPAGLAAFLRETGTAGAVFQPIARGRTVRALLMPGWRHRITALEPRSSRLLELIGVEAAVAIDRGTALERLVSMARTDALTGLPNRRCWEEELARETARASRLGSPLAVAMIDLDGFKALNDAGGHQVGDAILAGVAESWRPLLRSTDLLARYGGDEFAIALPSCSLGECEQLLARLQAVDEGRIGFCAGLAEWDSEEDAVELVGRADQALYQAKARGPGAVIVAG